MRPGQGLQRSIVLFSVVSVLATQAFSVVSAEKNMTRLDEPFALKSETCLNSKTTQVGEPFQGRLAENYTYQGKLLPVNSLFKGKVAQVAPSRRFSRPAYFVLAIDEVQLTNGEVITLSPTPGFAAESAKIHNDDPITIQRIARKGGPLTLVSTATSIPLGVASSLGGGVIYAITLGARMTTGAVQGLFTRNTGHGALARVADGAFYGTGVTPTWEFLSKDDELDIANGSIIMVKLPPESVKRLYDLDTLVVSSPSPPIIPTSGGNGAAAPVVTPATGIQPVPSSNPAAATSPVLNQNPAMP